MVSLRRRKSLLVVLAFLTLNALGWAWTKGYLERDAQACVALDSALPRGDADHADRLVLVFDRALYTGEEPPDPAALLTLDPPPPGEWNWAAPDRLEYVLAEKLPPGRVFRVHPLPDFELRTGLELDWDDDVAFRTRSLALIESALSIAADDQLLLAVHFNQPVLPADLLQHLTVDDGQARVENDHPARRIYVRVSRTVGERVRFTIDGQLRGHGADRSLGANVRRSHPVPAWFGLSNSRFTYFANSVAHPDRGTIELTFSADIDRSAPPPTVTCEPPVENLGTRWSNWRSELLVDGDFRPGHRYRLTVPRDLVAKDGRAQKADQTAVVEIPARDPALWIPFERGFLTPEGALALDACLVNTPRLKLRAFRVHENNLVPHLQRHRLGATAREVLESEITVDIERDRAVVASLDLSSLLPAPLGLYQIDLSSTEDRWVRDRAVVAITDLAVTVKKGREGLSVWVTSIRTAEPVAGAAVTARSYNNQPLATGTTGSDGVVVLPVKANHPDGAPWVITAKLDEDLSFLKMDTSPWVHDEVDQSGRESPRGHDVFLYTERGVYRPGDTVRLTGIVRTAEGAVPPSFPVEIRVLRPDVLEVARIVATPGPQGLFHADFTTPDDSHTGPWTFRVALPGTERVLGGTVALVEEYIPARIEVAAATPDEPGRIEISANYFFGAPAAGLPLAARWRYRISEFESEALPDHRFTPAATEAPGEDRHEAVLDPEGRGGVTIPAPESPGRYEVHADVTVTEPGSRSVTRSVTTVLDTAERHLGVRPPEDAWAPVGDEFALAWAQRTPDDRPAPGADFSFTLHRVSHDSVYEEVNGRYTWKTVERALGVADGRILSEDAEGEIALACPSPGLHRLDLTDERSKRVTRLEFYAAAGAADARGQALAGAARLTLVPDRESYAPGETARILVRSPFLGTLLLTLETDRLEHREVRRLTSTEETVVVPLPATLRGGAFVTASVVRALDPDSPDWRPHRAAGVARIGTTHETHRLPVTLTVPERAEPGAALKVLVSVPDESPAMVHLWAVDEGILSLTGHETPDPHDLYFAARRLGVTSRDLFPHLLPDFRRPEGTLRIGGGGKGDKELAAAERLRRNPVPARRRTAAVVWTEAIPLVSGRAEVELDLPHVTGALRVMAVVVSGDRYGSAESRVTLTAPLLVEAGWPRFLAPGDRARVPIKVFNRSGDKRILALAATLEGPARLPGAAVESLVEVPDGESRTLWLTVEALALGPVTVAVRARAVGGGEELIASSEAGFPVRPAGPIESETRFARVDSGETLRLSRPEGFLGAGNCRIAVGGDPVVELRPAVERLIRYPYGCVEQTTSRLYAILHAPGLLGGDGDGRAEMVESMITAGIDRLTTMQTRSGGLAYWPGGDSASRWGTAYAAGFLVEAREAGHEIPGRFLDALLRYEAAALDNAQAGPSERALTCRVLAAFDSPPHGWMARLAEQPDKLDRAGRAHLAGAFHHAGRTDRALDVLGADTLGLSAPVTFSGRLTSPTRQDAVLLSTLLTVAPDHPWVAVLAGRLVKARRGGAWRSTLEDAAALAALVRYQQSRGAPAGPGQRITVRFAGLSREWDGGAPLIVDLPPDAGQVEVTAEDGAAWVALQTEGIRTRVEGRRYDRNLAVRREWLTPDGTPVDPAKIRVGDLVRVVVTLSSARAEGEVANVAVVDALPGGFEVENPRLATSADAGGGGGRPDRVEFLDDRVVLFARAGMESRRFVYAIRAVAAGSFVAPPVQASCMYEPGIASVNGGGRVEVGR